jgi:radical SAM protein with 4Fe4S-binding SPASM domain
MQHQTYCILAFNHLSIDPIGDVRPCCNYNFHHKEFPGDDWKFYNIQSGKSVNEMLSSKAHNSLRNDINNNVKHKFCDRCWVVEENNGKSYRNNWNDSFKVNESTLKKKIEIEYLELTLGNKCNIQCRMCNPWSSDLWADDIKNNPEINYWKTNVDNLNFEYYNTPEFDKLLEEILPSLKHINFLGGEPLFNNKYYQILDRLIQSGRSKDISIQFNTNLLALQDKNLDLWKNFKSVRGNISCDGIESVNEYVRYPGKWNKFTRNLDKIIAWQKELGGYEKLALQIHSTMSSLTWLNLGDLFNWCQMLPLNYKVPFLIQVTQPDYLDCIHMPDEIKKIGYNRALRSLENLENWQQANIRSLLDHVMKTPRDNNKWNIMIKETNKLDKVRNSSIIKIIPEFENYWNEKSI